jgi:hypothetical protein
MNGDNEVPIDLIAQIDQELQVTAMIIEALNSQPATSDVTNMLVQASATRDHLSLLKAHLSAAGVSVTVDPTDSSFLTLQAIGARLDRAIQASSLRSSSIDDINLLLSTVNKGFQIAHELTSA